MSDWVMPPGLPSSWAAADCEAHIRALAWVGEAVEWSDHWERRTRDITAAEAMRVLRNGWLDSLEPATPPYSGVKCVMRFTLPDLGTTSVVVSLSDSRHQPEPYLLIVTAY